jgi:influenza virus NS1A-binding protein
LVEKVDSFIGENFEKIINDSVDFTKLPCIKTRIIVHNEPENLREELATNMAARAISYFQTYSKMSDRVEQQIEALTQKSHLLFLEGNTLEDCSKINETTNLGACEVVQDYKRSKQSKSAKTAGHNSQPLGIQQIQHHVSGTIPIKLDASKVANAKYASNESLNSIGSSEADMEQEIESKLIALNQSSQGFWIVLSVLYRRLVVLSMQLTDDEDLTGSAESTTTTPPHETLNGNGHLIHGANVKQPTDLSQDSVLAKIANCAALVKQPIPPMSTARCSVGAVFLNGKIIVCGGYNRGECLKSAEEYDLESGKWKALPQMLTERGRLGSTVANGKLYAVGGSDGNDDLATVECFDPLTKKWSFVAPLGKSRSNNSCTELNGYIYCIGGSSDQQYLRECERFNLSTGEWESIAPLQTARSQAACVTWRGQIFVIGGSTRAGCSDSVEAYDPETNAWRTISKMSTPRRGCAVACCKNFLHVMGGNDGTQPLASCEILESPNSHWRSSPSLNTARANTNAVVTAGNAIYLVGGFDNVQFLSSVEVFESEALGWKSWVQKNLGRNGSLNEDDEETASIDDSSKGAEITPRASTATITAH